MESLLLFAALILAFGLEAAAGAFLGVLLLIGYIVWALRLFAHGTTPGKQVLGLEVVNESGRPVGFGTMFVREWIGKWISGFIFFLGFLWVLIDKDRQAWHDKFVGTYVVQKEARVQAALVQVWMAGAVVVSLIIVNGIVTFIIRPMMSPHHVSAPAGQTASAPAHPSPSGTHTTAPTIATDPMLRAATVHVLRKTFLPADSDAWRFSDGMTVTVQVVNTSGKDIRAIKGRVVFSTLFGESLTNIAVENDHGIRAGGQWTDMSTYTAILTDQQQVARSPLSDLKVTWEPIGIIFTDGTRLGTNE